MCGWRAHRPAGSSKATDVVIGGVRLSTATWHIELGGAIGWRSGRHFGRNEGEVLGGGGAMLEQLLVF